MGVDVGADGLPRCWWCLNAPELIDYHDLTWGQPLHDEHGLFELLVLESFQSGLSWLTILRKRDALRSAFAGWEVERVAAFGERDIQRLLSDSTIIRHKGKIEAAIANASATRALNEAGGTLGGLLCHFRPS